MSLQVGIWEPGPKRILPEPNATPKLRSVLKAAEGMLEGARDSVDYK